MDRAGNFLGHVIRRMNHPDGRQAWLESAWPSLVGPQLAAHTRPLRSVGNRLELFADSGAWQQQVLEMEQDLRARINHAWGGTFVREVACASSPPPTMGREFDITHTPFIRRRRA